MDATRSPAEPITLEGVPNFRDIGGPPATDGRIVRHRKVFRSGMLAAATDDDLAALESLGIRTIIDLRTRPETNVFGLDRLPHGASLVPLAIPSIGADPIVEAALRSGRFPYLPDLVEVNRSYLRNDAERLGELLELLSDPANQPVLIHCLGGKDRTGVTVALLLTILGVPWSVVREDYLRSNAFFEGTVDGQPNSLSRAMEARIGRVPDFGDESTKREFFVLRPEYIDVVLDEMTRDGRSIADFVREELRLSADTVQRLQSELLEPMGPPTMRPRKKAPTGNAGDQET
jgi:protein-tyrosine phosphatase